MTRFVAVLAALVLSAFTHQSFAFAPRRQACLKSRSVVQRRAPVVSMVDIPRITRPEKLSDALDEQGLKNPNDLSDAEYNTYSAAAIGGTLIFMALPGAALFLDFQAFFAAIAKDFLFSALIGGGIFAYLSLRQDDVSVYANKFGEAVLTQADKILDGERTLEPAAEVPAEPAVEAEVEEPAPEVVET